MTIRNGNGLTPREQQILERLLSGETTRAISDIYGINRQTVKNYVTVIYEKLGVSGRAELFQVATRALALRPGTPGPGSR